MRTDHFAVFSFATLGTTHMRTRIAHCLIACLVCLSGQVRAEDQYFDSGGVQIRYTVAGEGEPVLLIHGYTANIEMQWELPGVIEALSSDYQVIALDNRGHGKSDKPHDPEEYGMEMVRDAVRLLDHLQIEKAHVVGYSMGAMITSKLLATHPERVLTATLGGSGGLREGGDLKFFQDLADSLEAGRGMGPLIAALTPPGQPQPTPDEIKAINEMLTATNDTKALAAVARAFGELAVSADALKSNRIPTLSVIGADDPLKPGVDAIKGVMSNLEVFVIEDADHMTAFGHPEFSQAILKFLDGHRSAVEVETPAIAPAR
jgi:pimeloyl-ACP methyl ester carboxylesterase